MAVWQKVITPEAARLQTMEDAMKKARKEGNKELCRVFKKARKSLIKKVYGGGPAEK